MCDFVIGEKRFMDSWSRWWIREVDDEQMLVSGVVTEEMKKIVHFLWRDVVRWLLVIGKNRRSRDISKWFENLIRK